MANFQPFNRYTLFLLDKVISRHNLTSPFLDIGCGAGELSHFLAKKGWSGKAVDNSKFSIDQATSKLKDEKNVQVIKKDFLKENGNYNSIFLWDVIEHLKDDNKALSKISTLLNSRGHLIISVPSNPNEWGWDDEFYGHYRRYTPQDMARLLKRHGFETLVIWDSTYPIFWAIRKLYLSFKKKPKLKYDDKEYRTGKSATEIAWNIPFLSAIANNSKIIWYPVYIIQYVFFRNLTKQGFEMLVLARKIK